jgi:hypothetical protein
MADHQPEDVDGGETDEYPLAPSAGEPPPLDHTFAPGCDPDQLDPLGPQPDDSDRLQFSQGELLLLVAGISVFLSIAATILKFLPKGSGPQAFAGLMGFFAFACWVVMVAIAPERRIVVVGWWALIALYLVTCVVAGVQGAAGH